MILYHNPKSCSQVVRIIAAELNIPLELESVDLSTGKLEKNGQNFSEINPKGYVPALQLEDGTLLTEGVAIHLYLASLKPDSTISPPVGSVEYFKMVSWSIYISTELHKNFSPLFARLFGMDVDQKWVEMTSNLLKQRYQLIETQLGKTSFLMGEAFTCADAYLYITLLWTSAVDLDLSNFPNIQNFFAKVSARESVKSIS